MNSSSSAITPRPTDFFPVDHAAIAQACGATGIRVTDPADLGPVLSKATASGRACLVEVICDPTAYPPITAWDDVADARILGTEE